MDPEKKAMQLQMEKLEKQNELMRKLATREGFFDQYFSELNFCKTNEEAFHKVNELCFELFGEYRYSDVRSFRNTHSRKYKKNN